MAGKNISEATQAHRNYSVATQPNDPAARDQSSSTSRILFSNGKINSRFSLSTTARPDLPVGQQNQHLLSTLKECIDGKRPLISLRSAKGISNCKQLIQDKTPAIRTKFPSVFQSCLEKLHASRQKPVTLGNGYTLESATIDSLLTKDIEVPYLRGTLAVRDPAGHTQTVHTLELAPQFDGAALNSKALLQCFNQIQDFKATVNPHSSEAHYASHKSHLRGPALMVLDGFNQLLVAKHPPARLNPPIVVDRLIAQVRETIGPAALHDKGQVRELHLACQDLATQSQAGKSGEVSSNQSVDSSASTVKVANLPPPFQVKFKRTKPVETPTQPQATPKQTVAPRAQPSIPVKKVTFSLSHELAHFEQAQRGVSIKTTQGTIKPVPFRQAHRQLISGQIKPQSVAQLFPQLKSLGNNGISRFFGIKNLDQAKDYLQNPTLRDNLDSASKALLSRHLKNKDLSSIEGLDVEKIQASMTLFSRASEQPDNLYKQVLNTHFKGKEHLQTLINLRIVFEV